MPPSCFLIFAALPASLGTLEFLRHLAYLRYRSLKKDPCQESGRCAESPFAAPNIVGAPLVEGTAPLWLLPYADNHGAHQHFLGLGMLYYAIAYVQKPRVCVVIGSGSGFVPTLIRRGQIDSGMRSGTTYLIDLGVEDTEEHLWETTSEFPEMVHDPSSSFRRAFPEIVVLKMRSVPDGVRHLRESGAAGGAGGGAGAVDLLFVDGDHSYGGARADVEGFRPLLARNAAVVIHDITPRVPHLMQVYQVFEELRNDSCWDALPLVDPLDANPWKGHYGTGAGLLRWRC